MKKLLIISFLLLFSALLFCTPALAADITDEESEIVDTNEVNDALSDDAHDIIGDFSAEDATDLDTLTKKLAAATEEIVSAVLGTALKNGAAILTVAILCSIAATVYDKELPNWAVMAGVIAAASLSFTSSSSFLSAGTQALDELDIFSKALLPVLTTAAAASGAVTSAAAKYAATALFMDVLLTASKSIVMPLIYAYLAAGVASAVLGGEGLTAATALIKRVAGAALTLIVLAFTIYLSLTGIISSATDATTTKLVKTVIAGALPVVGSIISDAAGTVLGGMSILKNTIGVFGLAAVCAVCMAPVIKMSVHYLVYKAVAALTSAIADKRIAKVADIFAGAFAMTMGLVGSAAIMLFISIISVMKVVNVT